MRKLLIVAVATMFAFSMSAQKFGVKVGANMSGYTVNFYTPEGAKMGKGFNFAALAELPVSDAMDLRIDLGFNQLGSDYKDSGDDYFGNGSNVAFDIKSTTNVNYLKLGVSPKFNFGSAYAAIGPYFGYGINGKTKSTVTVGDNTTDSENGVFKYETEEENGEEVTNESIKRTDLGLNLTLGANFSSLFVEFNAGMGMTNFLNKDYEYYKDSQYKDKDHTEVVAAPKQKNLFFGLSVGYMFGE